MFPQNLGSHLSIDETALTYDELYTIVTNKAAKGKKGALVAIVKGTKAEDVMDHDFPWIYEIGLDTYKVLKSSKTKAEKIGSIENFEDTLKTLEHPMYREIFGKSEEMYMYSKDIRRFIH